MAKNPVYNYYRLSPRGLRREQYMSYTDIAIEHGVSRNSVAGKFDRAKKNERVIINVNGTKIEKVLKEQA